MQLWSFNPKVVGIAAVGGIAAVSTLGFAARFVFRDSPDLIQAEKDALLGVAETTRHGRWAADTDISAARNAHYTNTPAELGAALIGPYDWFEGDVRMSGGRPVMAHEPWQRDGMWLADWLEVGAESGRGLKLDIKDPDAIGPLLDELAQHRVHPDRLILNVPVGSAPGAVTDEQLRQLRAEWPTAIINLSPDRPYSDKVVAEVRAAAKLVGGPVMVPLHADHVDAEVVAAMKQAGRVAIWSDDDDLSRAEARQLTKHLREIGVDGMIDVDATWRQAS